MATLTAIFGIATPPGMTEFLLLLLHGAGWDVKTPILLPFIERAEAVIISIS